MKQSSPLPSGLRLNSKKGIVGAFISPVFGYESAVLSLNVEMKSRINVFEKWCYRKLLRVIFVSHTGNV